MIYYYSYSLKENKDILTGWEDVIAGIAKSLIKEQSPKQYAHVLPIVLVVTNYDIVMRKGIDFVFRWTDYIASVGSSRILLSMMFRQILYSMYCVCFS